MGFSGENFFEKKFSPAPLSKNLINIGLRARIFVVVNIFVRCHVGRGPHMVVFSLGREKEKKKLAVNINYISWRKNVRFPHVCLFISPGSTGSRCCGDSGLPLALPLVHVPQLCVTVAPANCCILSGAGELVFSHKWLWLLKTALPSGCIFLPPGHCPQPPASLPRSSPASFSDILTLNIFLNLRLG